VNDLFVPIGGVFRFKNFIKNQGEPLKKRPRRGLHPQGTLIRRGGRGKQGIQDELSPHAINPSCFVFPKAAGSLLNLLAGNSSVEVPSRSFPGCHFTRGKRREWAAAVAMQNWRE
jgi:hypothetical protein